jgi:hypothetical protein
MQEQANERWYQLCQLAAVELDSEKLMKLVAEVNLLLEAKEVALTSMRLVTMPV